MSDTSRVTNERKSGSSNAMDLMQVAKKLLPTANGQAVSVWEATDEEFQFFIDQAGIPVEGDAGWSFDDRYGVICYALAQGIALPFIEQNNSPTVPAVELFMQPEVAQQAV